MAHPARLPNKVVPFHNLLFYRRILFSLKIRKLRNRLPTILILSIMSKRILRIHPNDNVLVALTDLKKGESFTEGNASVTLVNDIPAKHKFVINAMAQDEEIRMYGL